MESILNFCMDYGSRLDPDRDSKITITSPDYS